MAETPEAAARGWLEWYRIMGADDLVGDAPVDRLRIQPADNCDTTPQPALATPGGIPGPAHERQAAAGAPPVARDRPRHGTPSEAPVARDRRRRPPPEQALLLRSAGSIVESAREIARSCATLDQLAAAVAEFDGCALRETALNCCFADGSPEAELMMVGEAPGAEEDRQGKPFVGPSGKLLDKMLATIEHDRGSVYITNCIYWRPPGNRSPTQAEIAACQPFLERQIEILRPRLLVFVGGIAARGLLGVKDGVTKLRGRRLAYTLADGSEIPAMVMFHPAYLLRQASQKRFAWRDLLTIRQLLRSGCECSGGN